MCISSFKKYYLRLIAILLLGYLFFNPGLHINTVLLIALFILVGILGAFIKCPKCGQIIGSTKNGMPYIPFKHTCRHCGQNTDICKVEEDKVTNRRLEKLNQ